jgi:hypothetical protein
MNTQQMQRTLERLATVASVYATQEFDEVVSPVRRLTLRPDPATRMHFLVMAVLKNGQRFEGRIDPLKSGIAWCHTPNCNCMGFVRIRCRVEVGITVDD